MKAAVTTRYDPPEAVVAKLIHHDGQGGRIDL
jgi:hypothetical protein